MSEMEQQPICKIALGIEYDGSKYYGWQRQNASAQRAGEAGKGALAGGERTDYRFLRRPHADAGVHGIRPGGAFETRAQRKDAAWTLGSKCEFTW